MMASRFARHLALFFAAILGFVVVRESLAFGQTPLSAKTMATVDLTGYWVSLVNEDWGSRMTVPEKGNVAGIPATQLALDAANAWDPAKDESEGNQCKGYGGAAIMRAPTRIHV